MLLSRLNIWISYFYLADASRIHGARLHGRIWLADLAQIRGLLFITRSCTLTMNLKDWYIDSDRAMNTWSLASLKPTTIFPFHLFL